jgi:CubicO group peptidase (beta-lactamase class C family)
MLTAALSALDGRAARRALAALALVLGAFVGGVPVAARQAPHSTALASPLPGEVRVPPSGAAVETALPSRLDPADVEAFVDGYLASYMAENEIVGGVVSIVENGRVVLAKGYGDADRERHREVDPQRTLFRVGSVSKLFVWTAVMQLVDRGRLDLDTDVNRYLDGVTLPETFPEPVTLAHLMTHTAGFEDRVIGLFARDPAAVRPLQTVLADRMPARVRAPGALASYSNHGAALAMLIVEQVSKTAWIDFLETQILEPLEMRRTTFRQPVPDALLDDLATGYRQDDHEPKAESFEYIPLAPAGAASATASDMARFMIALLDLGRLGESRILSETSARRMRQTLHRHEPGLTGMAYGFIEGDRNGQRVLGHGGSTLWFNTQLELYPDSGLGVFASFNTQGADPQRLAQAFADHVFPAAEWSPLLPPPDWTERARRFAGSYRSLRYSHHDLTKLAALTSQLEVSDDGAGALRLSSRPGRRWIQIEPLLFRDAEGTATIGFRERGGRITHLFMGEVPVFAFERVPWYESRGLHLALLGAELALFLATVVLWPAGALLRFCYRAPPAKPEGRLPWLARAVLWLGSLVFLVYFAGLVWLRGDLLGVVFGLSAKLRQVLLLPLLGAAMAVAAFLCAIWIWRAGRGGKPARLGYALVTVALMIALWQLAVWRLLGTQG